MWILFACRWLHVCVVTECLYLFGCVISCNRLYDAIAQLLETIARLVSFEFLFISSIFDECTYACEWGEHNFFFHFLSPIWTFAKPVFLCCCCSSISFIILLLHSSGNAPLFSQTVHFIKWNSITCSLQRNKQVDSFHLEMSTCWMKVYVMHMLFIDYTCRCYCYSLSGRFFSPRLSMEIHFYRLCIGNVAVVSVC